MKAYVGIIIPLMLIAIMVSQSLSAASSIYRYPIGCPQTTNGLKTAGGLYYCFLSLPAKLTWEEARYECWSKQGYLVEADSLWLSIIAKNFSIDTFWTGFNDLAQEDRFSGDYYNQQPIGWRKDEPNGGRGENCAAYRKGGFTDYNCRNRYYAVCQIGPSQVLDRAVDLKRGHCHAGFTKTNIFSRSCFKVFRSPKSWSAASASCSYLGFRLARLQNFQGALAARGDQLTLVAYLARGAGNLWMGDSPCRQYVHTTRQFKSLCGAALPYVCEQVFGYIPLKYRNYDLSRCPSDRFIRSVRGMDYTSVTYKYDGNHAAVLQQCAKHKMVLPDHTTMDCLYDAMKAISKFYPSFASLDSGPLLMPYRKGNLKFMNQHGHQYDPQQGKSYAILCTDPAPNQ